MQLSFTLVAAVVCGLVSRAPARADAVTDWNAALEAAQKASGLTGSSQARSGAIMHAAVFDAVNGIAQRYSPYFVTHAAPPGAREEAAAIEAAYTALVSLYPSRKPAFDAQLEISLGLIAGDEGNSRSIAQGREWGRHVAQLILAWRASDGFANVATFFGSAEVGWWRSGLSVGLSGVSVQFASMTPFTMTSPAQFRSSPPYGTTNRAAALATAAYAADLNEVKARGRGTGSTRTPAETQLALFWHASDLADLNRAIRPLLPANARLVDTARLFALMNLAAADSAVAFFEAKYAHAFWRPFHGIILAADDNNPATLADSTWTSLITTPRHPEYPSAHVAITSAPLCVAAVLLGGEHPLTLSTPAFPDLTVSYPNFAAAIDGVIDARICIGFHFRGSCEEGRDLGANVAAYVVGNFMRARHGRP